MMTTGVTVVCVIGDEGWIVNNTPEAKFICIRASQKFNKSSY
jgi:hypothetical protein